MIRRYRRIRLKDTSKRSLVIRADKRERFLVYSYVRGEFIQSPDKDPRKMKLVFRDVNRHDCYFDKVMIDLLSKVNWFQHTNTEYEDGVATYTYENAPPKKYMRILYKSNKLTAKKGILYFYTPLVFFAWLTAPTTIFNKTDKTVSFKVNRKEELEDVRDWFYYGNLEEVTGDRDNHYEINVTIDEENCRVIIDEENIIKMIKYSSKDKYIYKYSDALCEHVRKELDISGEEESWSELREQCRANAGKRAGEDAYVEAKRTRQVLCRSNGKQKGFGRKNRKSTGDKRKIKHKVHTNTK